MSLRVVCISDTHMHHSEMDIPDGDILIHSGDSTKKGTYSEIETINNWLGTLPHKHKILIAGNHDFGFQNIIGSETMITNATYLEDSEITIEGLRIYGSPWVPNLPRWAFHASRERLREIRSQIPEGLDLLVVHGPPYGIKDKVLFGPNVGCEELRQRLDTMERPPRYCIFGHIHEEYGIEYRDKTIFVNAANCDVNYRAVNPPIVLTL